MHREHRWAHIRGRKSNTQSFMDFNIYLIINLFYKNTRILKVMIFGIKNIFFFIKLGW